MPPETKIICPDCQRSTKVCTVCAVNHSLNHNVTCPQNPENGKSILLQDMYFFLTNLHHGSITGEDTSEKRIELQKRYATLQSQGTIL